MSGTIFEVHTLKGGTWMIDSTHKDRDAAMEVARSLYGEKVYDGVKVVKDVFDPVTNASKEIVIFDTAKQSAERKAPPPAAKKAAAPAGAAKADVDFGRHQPAAKAKGGDGNVVLKSLAWLVALLFGGILLIWLIYNFSGLLVQIGVMR